MSQNYQNRQNIFKAKRLHNRIVAGKQPFRIKFGMTGVLPKFNIEVQKRR